MMGALDISPVVKVLSTKNGFVVQSVGKNRDNALRSRLPDHPK